MPQGKKTFILTILLAALVMAACSPVEPFTLDATIAARSMPFAAIFPTAAPRQTSTTTPAISSTSMTPDTSPSDKTVQTTPEAATPTDIPTVDPNRLNGITIQFWNPWSGAVGDTVEELVKSFNLSNELGIQVQITSPGSLENLSAQMDEAIQTNSTPDLAAAYLFQALDWNTRHPLVDLNGYINSPTWGLKPVEQADFFPVFWESGLINGKRLAVPALRSGQLLYYNQTWAQELGFTTPPVTPEQLEQQACAAAKANKSDDIKDNDGTGGLILSTSYSPMLSWIEAFGGKIFDPAKTTAKTSPYNFAAPQVASAFTFLRGLYDKGCAWLPEEPYSEHEFAGRRGLFAAGSVTSLPYQNEVMQQNENPDQWTVIPFPSPDGHPAVGVYGPDFNVFSSTPEKQLAAWVFARWLLSPQNLAQLAQAEYGFPVRKSSLDEMKDFQASQPQWAAAQQTLEYAQPEPTARSWNTVRWALSDAATQLFRSYFTIDKVPELVKLLNQTAADLHSATP